MILSSFDSSWGAKKMENISKLYLGSYGHNSEENVQKKAKYGVFTA